MVTKSITRLRTALPVFVLTLAWGGIAQAAETRTDGSAAPEGAQPCIILPGTFAPLEAEPLEGGRWRQLSGPATAFIVSPDRHRTYVRFPADGVYVLRYGQTRRHLAVGCPKRSDTRTPTRWFGNTWANSGWKKGPTGDGLSHYKHREGCFMQMAVDDLHVFADGTIITNCIFDEGISPIAIYREVNGEPVRVASTGYGHLHGGRAICSDGTYLYATVSQTYGGPNYLVRLTHRGEAAPIAGSKGGRMEKVLLRKNPPPTYNRNLVPPQGLAVIGEELFWSDTVDPSIKVLHIADLSSKRRFALDSTRTAGGDVPLKLAHIIHEWVSQLPAGAPARAR